jgi:hypothetical protein
MKLQAQVAVSNSHFIKRQPSDRISNVRDDFGSGLKPPFTGFLPGVHGENFRNDGTCRSEESVELKLF